MIRFWRILFMKTPWLRKSFRHSLLTPIGLLLGLTVLTTLTSCDIFFGANTLPIPTVTRASDSQGNTYEVGFIQVTGIRQDPFVQKLSPSGATIWEIRHDETLADARGIAVAIGPQGVPYVLFSVDGGSNASTRFQTHRVIGAPFNGKPFPSYGNGGGPKVTIVARLNPTNGFIDAATYIIARTDRTNTFRPRGIAVVNDQVFVDGNSAAWPPGPGAKQGSWVNHPARVSGAFNDTTRRNNDLFRVLLPLDLSEFTDVIWLDNRN